MCLKYYSCVEVSYFFCIAMKFRVHSNKYYKDFFMDVKVLPSTAIKFWYSNWHFWTTYFPSLSIYGLLLPWWVMGTKSREKIFSIYNIPRFHIKKKGSRKVHTFLIEKSPIIHILSTRDKSKQIISFLVPFYI